MSIASGSGAAPERAGARSRPFTGAGLGLLALAAALQQGAAGAPDVVERGYSRGLYPVLATALGRVSDAVPFALAEWSFAAGVLLALRAGWRGWRRRRPGGRLLPLLVSGLALAGWAWFAFLLLWGLNYRRLPLARSLGLDTRAPAVEELASLCEALVALANRQRAGLPEDERGVMRLRDGRRGLLNRVALGSAALRGAHPWIAWEGARAKPFAASPLFAYLGITGMYVPFSGEAHVNATLPDPELPFVAAHELAHRQGYAREDEASYLGYAACQLHPDGDVRYSGTLAASVYALGALAAADRARYEAIAALRSPAVARDLAALDAWSRRHRSVLSELARAVNDVYLRSQGQAAGVASYGRMVDLLIAERRARPADQAAGG